MSVRNAVERAIYRTYRELSRRSQRPELPPDVPEHLALPDDRSPARKQSDVAMPAAALVTTLVVSIGAAFGSGVYLGNGYDDVTSTPASGIEEQAVSYGSSEWRAEHDVCLAKHQAREGGDAGVFTAAEDPKLDACYARQAEDAAQIRAGTE